MESFACRSSARGCFAFFSRLFWRSRRKIFDERVRREVFQFYWKCQALCFDFMTRTNLSLLKLFIFLEFENDWQVGAVTGESSIQIFIGQSSASMNLFVTLGLQLEISIFFSHPPDIHVLPDYFWGRLECLTLQAKDGCAMKIGKAEKEMLSLRFLSQTMAN
jgi:hypothetical protein